MKGTLKIKIKKDSVFFCCSRWTTVSSVKRVASKKNTFNSPADEKMCSRQLKESLLPLFRIAQKKREFSSRNYLIKEL
jgi:hypothetical protein